MKSSWNEYEILCVKIIETKLHNFKATDETNLEKLKWRNLRKKKMDFFPEWLRQTKKSLIQQMNQN